MVPFSSRSPVLFAPLLAFAVALGACSSRTPEGVVETARVADESSRRVTPSGEVIGFAAPGGAHVWLGLPFAEPPVGDLRWRAPRPAPRWAEPLRALSEGPACPQYANPLGPSEADMDGAIVGDEDCLVLNVYAPRFAPESVPTGSARLPVMVWIHGGGNSIGHGGYYDGSTLATRHGLIVITTNYRLGALGWFRHPSLQGDSVADSSGNYGTLDLVRALEWVRDHVAAFGGDPGNVTIFGESAGATNVMTLLASPLARGLFHRAIAQSGGTSSVEVAEAENWRDDPEPGHAFSSREVLARLLIADQSAADRAEARARAASMTPGETAAYLRGKSAVELLSTYEASRGFGMYESPKVFRDGAVLPAAPILERLAAGSYNRVPALLGTNRDETKLFQFFDDEQVRRWFGIFPRLRDPERYHLEAEYYSKMWKVRGADAPAAALRAVQGPSVFVYRWDWDEEPRILFSDLSEMIGAAHGLEISFVFGRFEFGRNNRFFFDESNAPGRERLSAAMMSYWAQFAYAGDPGRGREGDLPHWKAWDLREGAPKFIVLDTDSDGGIRMTDEYVTKESVLAEIDADPRLSGNAELRCDVYAGLVRWGRNLSEQDYAQAGCGELGTEDVAAR